MAEITRKRTGEFLRKLFEILIDAPDGMQARDALTALSGLVTLTDYEAGMFDSGGQRFEKIVRFATVDCVKAGWLVKHKGTWTITEAGIAAYRELKDPELFYRTALKFYRQWKQAQRGEVVSANSDVPSKEITVIRKPASPSSKLKSRLGMKSNST